MQNSEITNYNFVFIIVDDKLKVMLTLNFHIEPFLLSGNFFLPKVLKVCGDASWYGSTFLYYSGHLYLALYHGRVSLIFFFPILI